MASPAEIVQLASRRYPPPTGGTRVICVDGYAGAGKTTLALGVAEQLHCDVVHMDDLYDGWTGVEHGIDQAAAIVASLGRGAPGWYRRYDWHACRFAESVQVACDPWLVVEGVGAGSARVTSHGVLLVWVEAPADLRLVRGLERDGEAVREHWLAFTELEQELHRRERTRSRADLVVAGA